MLKKIFQQKEMERRQKILHYLKSNYQFMDNNILQLWASYLDNERYVKQKKQKLVWTAQGAQEMSKYLSNVRKQKTQDFKIQLKGLLQRVPNDFMIFENAKHHPMFPVVFLYIYMKNKHVYDAFHRKYIYYPYDMNVLNSLLQQDELWSDKYTAGQLYSDLTIRFMTSFPHTQIIISTCISSDRTLFKAELRKNRENTVFSTMNCPCPERKIFLDLKLSLLVMFLMAFDYDRSSLIRILTRELESFRLLVPDFVSQITTIFVSPKQIADILNTCKKHVNDFQTNKNTLPVLLLQNLRSWSFAQQHTHV
jgi:hypothetical protein